MNTLPDNIVSEFQQITNRDIAVFLNEYTSFLSNDVPNIISYYSGQVSQPKERSFIKLDELLVDIVDVISTVNSHRNSFNNTAFWELVEALSEIETHLETIGNSSKWMRSVIGKNEFSNTIEREDHLKQNETLEMMSVRFGSLDKDNDWTSIALRNDLIEEQYTPDGGNVLNININKKRFIGSISGVVDTLQGKRMYGIDLTRKITFDSTIDDLKTLSYDETIKQSVEILSRLRQGDTPEFPLDGIQSSLVVGSNRNAVAYPILFRQFYNTFRGDDTLSNLNISNISNKQDSLAIEFTVNTVLGESLIQESLL